LFYQIALQFFRESGAHAQQFLERRAELERLDKARSRRARQVSARRSQVARALSAFEQALDEGRIAEDADTVLRGVQAGVEQAVAEPDPARAAAAVVRLEDRARADLRAASEKYRVERPHGMTLSKPLARRYARYEDARALIQQEILEPARQQVDLLLDEAVKKHQLGVARQLRLENAATAAIRRARDATRAAQRELNQMANATTKRAGDLGRRHFASVEDAAAEVQAQLAALDVTNTSDEELTAFRAEFERDLGERRTVADGSLGSVTYQLAGLVWPENGSSPLVTMLDQVEALETDLDALSEQAEDQLELTQLGMAVEVINHEFRHTVQSIRRTLKQFKVWADANPKLRAAYEELKASFDHLDGYLTLFTPLQRRLHRTAVEMVGSEIETFLRDLFEKRLDDSKIEIQATPAFKSHRLQGFPSTIYPVFVNLVDNAIFWLTGYSGDRVISLDAGADWMAVRDTGPGLPVDLGEDIFQARVSTKPGGSGYGLFVARQVIERDGMRLVAQGPSVDAGAELRILESAG
jgi:signal transduction histidine kinase